MELRPRIEKIGEKILGLFSRKKVIKRPMQCPQGHHMISWFFKEDDVFCQLCYRVYPISECFHAETPEKSRVPFEKWILLQS